jgi:hypothetical protein
LAFNDFKSIVERGHGILHSRTLANEMKIVVRENDTGFLGATGRGKDDCTMASAISAQCYTRYFLGKLKQMNVTWNAERARRAKVVEVGRDETPQEAAIARCMGSYMKAIGIKYGEPSGK